MTLTLTIRNFDRLDNGMPAEYVLHRRGALIGRATTNDWCLPDPRKYISSKHAEVSFAGGFYTLTDISLNGVFLNGSADRMPGPRRIEDGDLFAFGQYEVVARLTGEAIAAVEDEAEASRPSGDRQWRGWEAGIPPVPPAPPVADDGWGPAPLPPPGSSPAAAARHPGGDGWTPSARMPDPPRASTWEAEAPPSPPASAWSSAAPDRPPPPLPDDIWGKMDEGNIVDWARGGFGHPEAPLGDPLGLDKPAPIDARRHAEPQAIPSWGPPGISPATWTPHHSAQQEPPLHPAAPPAAGEQGDLFDAFLEGAGVDPGQLKEELEDTMVRAGELLRHLVAGLFLMVEARARAKSQMGAEVTSFSFDGNNPLKFASSPEEALALLLSPPQRGFVDGTLAVEEAFFDLQSHQVATLKAMQGALKATLDRFSPRAIRQRAEAQGMLAKILPNAREAALWKAYEKEFGGVAQGSDEAFIDVFAREFRDAYQEQSARQPRR